MMTIAKIYSNFAAVFEKIYLLIPREAVKRPVESRGT
jgi:hypothetical protein